MKSLFFSIFDFHAPVIQLIAYKKKKEKYEQ
jgi:hypothetical protein